MALHGNIWEPWLGSNVCALKRFSQTMLLRHLLELPWGPLLLLGRLWGASQGLLLPLSLAPGIPLAPPALGSVGFKRGGYQGKEGEEGEEESEMLFCCHAFTARARWGLATSVPVCIVMPALSLRTAALPNALSVCALL